MVHMATQRQPGTRRSCTMDHSLRSAEATKENVARIAKIAIRTAMVSPPQIAPIPCWKMAIRSYPVGVCRSFSTSPTQQTEVC